MFCLQGLADATRVRSFMRQNHLRRVGLRFSHASSVSTVRAPAARTLAVAGALFAFAALGCKGESKPTPSPAAAPSTSSSSASMVAPATTLPDLDTLLNLPASEGAQAANGDGGAGAGTGDPAAAALSGAGGSEVGTSETIKLVEAGGEPRTAARYEFAIDKPQTVTATVRINAEGGGVPPGQGGQPPIRLTLKATPKAKNGAKTAFALEVSKAEIMLGNTQIPPEAAKELKAAEAALTAITATFSASDRGAVSDLHVGAKGAPPEVQELFIPMLEMLFAPLPEEPIGVGARWVSNTAGGPAEGGASMQSTFTMVNRSPASADISVDTVRAAKPQPIPDPRAPAGSTVQMDGKGKTKLTVRFAGVASKAEGESTTNITVREPAGGANPARTTKSKVTVHQSLDSK